MLRIFKYHICDQPRAAWLEAGWTHAVFDRLNAGASVPKARRPPAATLRLRAFSATDALAVRHILRALEANRMLQFVLRCSIPL